MNTIATQAPHSVRRYAKVVTEIPGPKSKALAERRSNAVSDSVPVTLATFIEKADSNVLHDVDGNSLIDFAGGIGVSNVGNGNARVVERVQEQVEDFAHVCFAITPYEEYVQVCELLNEHAPGDHAKKSALWNSGAEAVENAVKVARSYTGRSAVVVFRNAFHGRTNLTMAMTAKNMPYKEGFGPFASDVYRVPMANPFGFAGTPEECAEATLREVRTMIDKEIGASNVACIVMEPIQGEGGFIVPAPNFAKGIRDYCTENGIVFIADEVQSGFGRTGTWFAIEHEGVVPDIITTAKALGGGLPLAAVTGRAEMMDSVHVGGLGSTFGGNPVSCVGSIAAFESVERDGLLEKAKNLEAIFRRRLEQIQQRHSVVADIRGRGAMMAIELADDSGPDAARAVAVQKWCHQNGALAIVTGTFGNVIRFLPPLSMSPEVLEEGLDILSEAFDATA
ncbi:4-aminobutyrate--2-oxoglutarate transaminase [Ruicaihuangia caeni]|uniref:(S)-3-amino-2-methylpropionate transaminase n=1 Tax=Ruicaihuangia caeni TaxID=3042517 RepID=A0AAW6T6G3_9MICO|nr:4-aminobutyrate--2-oxoglutarate transaminase [Klugiella sp. YN-L-19]MDI2099089.1 4-aminobutyrate--2-oxoglutarate transaminase [Klugiella sp. YN-L-19]